MSDNMLEWKSFSVNDLLKDFNKVIEGSVHNMYNVSLIKYIEHISQLKKIINLSMMLDDKGNGIQIEELKEKLAEGERVIMKFKDEKNMILEKMEDFLEKNDKEYKIDNYCLNKLKSDKNFTFYKSNLELYFSSQHEKDEKTKMLEQAQEEARATAGGTTTEPNRAEEWAEASSHQTTQQQEEQEKKERQAGQPGQAVQPRQEVGLGGKTTTAAAAAGV